MSIILSYPAQICEHRGFLPFANKTLSDRTFVSFVTPLLTPAVALAEQAGGKRGNKNVCSQAEVTAMSTLCGDVEQEAEESSLRGD